MEFRISAMELSTSTTGTLLLAVEIASGSIESGYSDKILNSIDEQEDIDHI